jgi:outer membrane protein
MIRPSSLRHALFIAALLAVPAAAAEMRVGVVNLDRLMQESPQGRAVSDALQAEFGDKQRDLVNQQKELRALEERLNRDRAVMAEQERIDLEDRARALQQRYQRRLSEVEDDYNSRRTKELGALQRVIVREVQAHAKEGGYDMVVGAGVIWASPAADITGAVLKRLESQAAAPKAPAAAKAPAEQPKAPAPKK